MELALRTVGYVVLGNVVLVLWLLTTVKAVDWWKGRAGARLVEQATATVPAPAETRRLAHA